MRLFYKPSAFLNGESVLKQIIPASSGMTRGGGGAAANRYGAVTTVIPGEAGIKGGIVRVYAVLLKQQLEFVFIKFQYPFRA